MYRAGKNFIKIMVYLSFWVPYVGAKAIIVNGGSLQLGDNFAEFCLAKILSLQHNIPFFYYHNGFVVSDLFMLDVLEQKVQDHASRDHWVPLTFEQDLINNKDQDIVFYTTIRTQINHIQAEDIAALKKDLMLKEIPAIEELPDGIITVGLHIRKGSSGCEIYAGEQSSIQEFDFDRSIVRYLTSYDNFPFDWHEYRRNDGRLLRERGVNWVGRRDASGKIPISKIPIDRVGDWETKFPPNQFYIDQIIKVSNELQDRPIHVTVCTDDKAPEVLVDTIRRLVNKPNITFLYTNERHLSYREQMWHDLYRLSRTDIFIRSQSYFARTAELMGEHKVVIYPLSHIWHGNALIMRDVVIKGSWANLGCQ